MNSIFELNYLESHWDAGTERVNEGRCTCRHNSVLQFICSTFQTINGPSFFVDLPGFVNPSVTTGDRPKTRSTLRSA